MRKLQYKMILYLGLFLTIFVEVGRASEEITKADYLSKLPNQITNLILGYLEIPTCFKYLLVTKAYFANKHLRKFITERALQEHCVALITPYYHFPVYWNQLQYFLDSYLDSTITVPELPLIPFYRSRHPLGKTETEIVTYFLTEGEFKYMFEPVSYGMYYTTKYQPGPGRLPLIYDPMQSMLHIYPSQENQCKFSFRVRLPALLILKHSNNMAPTHIWISKMRVIKWKCVTKDDQSIITWTRYSEEWEQWTFFINPKGIVTAINFWVKATGEPCSFYSEEGKNQGKTFAIDPRENSGFIEIQAFYLPSRVYV